MTEKAISSFPDNLLIYSMWSGYLDKTHPAYEEYKADFIDKAKNIGSNVINLHTSGHATIDEIKQVVEITNPKTVIPIHSENPEAFANMGIKADIKILQDGECIIV